MVPLDRTEQRLVGVLVEKQLTVPDSYPMSENALVDGCNQKSNRDPITELATFQVTGALMALQHKGVVARVDGGGRVAKFRHKLDEQLVLPKNALPVLAELLLRGPQAPGALKSRVARMGYHAAAEQIEVLLRELAAQKPALVELLPLGPRERDRRWRHRLGDGSEHLAEDRLPADGAGGGATAAALSSPASAALSSASLAPAPAAPANGSDVAALAQRVTALEQQVRELQRALAARPPS